MLIYKRRARNRLLLHPFGLFQVSHQLKNYESEFGTKQSCSYEVRHFYKKLFLNPGLTFPVANAQQMTTAAQQAAASRTAVQATASRAATRSTTAAATITNASLESMSKQFKDKFEFA